MNTNFYFVTGGLHLIGRLTILLILIVSGTVALTAQQVSVYGLVTDENSEPLLGVNVLIKGTVEGTVTDLDGNYEIEAESGTTLVFSYIGYSDLEIIVGDNPEINAQLVSSATLMEEVVVTGYGQTQNKRYVSTAVNSLTPKEIIQDRPISRLENAIQGNDPAVVVLQESGSPGAAPTIRMRGISTAGNAQPLVLMDGVQVPDMNFINPNDVQSITILKDAASAAIYGARGGNGVILIEGREGESRIGKPTVTLSGYYGTQNLQTTGDYLTTRQYAEYYNASVIYLIREGLPINGRSVFSDEEMANLANTTWIEEVSGSAPIGDLHMGISGGTDKTKYYFGGGYFDQQGIIGNTDFSRLSFTFDLKTELAKGLDLSVFSTYSQNDRSFIAENSENSRLISSVTSLPPIYPVYAESGSPFNNGNRRGVSHNGVSLNIQPEFGNPVIGLTHTQNRSSQNVLFGNALLGWQIIEKLRFSTSFGYMSRNTDVRNFNARFSYDDQFIDNPINSLGETRFEETFKQWEGYFTIDAIDNDMHDLEVIAGMSALENDFLQTGRFGLNFFSNTIDEVNFSHIISDADKVIPNDVAWVNTTLSYYARANYTINQRYLLSATIRSDASSKFGENNRWGVFPSFSAGWIISSENFMRNSELFDLLKLRASWGINGNDQIAPYQYAERYVRGAGGSLSKLDYNENVKWEEISQTNFGIDANMLKGKLGITLDYYIKETSDMLLNFPNPGFLGLPPPVRNAATVMNQGLEVILLWRDRIGKEFNYNVGLNFGRTKNEVTDLGGGLPIEAANTRVFNGAPNLSRTDVGQPIASFYGFVFEGLDDAGNPVYKDLDGQEGITPDGDRTYIGSPYPDFVYGLNLGADFKGFDFVAFFYGTQGNDIVNASMGYGVQYSNRTTRVLDAWSLENPNSNVMRPSALDVVNHEFSDYYIEDGSYFRLKNITLGYTLKQEWTQRANIQRVRFFLSGSNVFTITNYSGLDPEIGANNDPLDVGVDRGFYPQPRTFTGGFQFTF